MKASTPMLPLSPAASTATSTAVFPAVVPAVALAPVPVPPPTRGALLAVGRAGTAALELILQSGLRPAASLAVSASSPDLDASSAVRKFLLPPASHERLANPDTTDSTALDPDLAAQVAALCVGKEFVLLLAGLGGHTGTRLGPLLVQAAKASGARVFALVTLPFDWEGRSRRQHAEPAWQAICGLADGVLCLPNQKAEKLVPDDAPVQATLQAPLKPLADAARGLWRTLTLPAKLSLRWPDLSAALQGRACIAFASAEATGAERAREVAEKLLTHPLLAGTTALGQAGSLVLNVIAGPDVRKDEIGLLTERIENGWRRLPVHVGLTEDPSLQGALSALLLVSAPPHAATEAGTTTDDASAAEARTGRASSAESTSTPNSSEGAMIPDAGGRGRRRRGGTAGRQEQLALEIFSRGRFDKSEPTIHKGEDLDVPTYIRRGVTLTALN